MEMMSQIGRGREYLDDCAEFTLGWLVERSFNWGQLEWTCEDTVMRVLVNNMISEHFYYRGLSLVPPARWRRRFISRMNEIMPKYITMLNQIDDINDRIFRTGTELTKGKRLDSKYPENIVSNDFDYLSDGNAYDEYKEMEGDILDKYIKYIDQFNTVWTALFHDLENLFTHNIDITDIRIVPGKVPDKHPLCEYNERRNNYE